MAMTPAELNFLQSKGIYLDQSGSPIEQPRYNPSYTPEEISFLKAKGLTPELDSNTVGETLSQFPRAAASSAANLLGGAFEFANTALGGQNQLLEDTAGGAKQLSSDIAGSISQNAQAAMSAPLSMSNFGIKASNLAGEVAPIVGAAAIGAPVLGAAGVGTALAVPMAGNSIQSFKDQRYKELANQGVTGSQADSIINQEALKVGAESFGLNAGGNLLSMRIGSKVAGLTGNTLKGIAAGAAVDAPIGAAQGAGEEVIQSTNLDRKFNSNNALEGAEQGALLGAGFGALGGMNNAKATKIKDANDVQNTQTDINKTNAADPQVQTRIVSAPLNAEGIETRLASLKSRPEFENSNLEVKPIVNPDGSLSKNRSVIVETRKITPPEIVENAKTVADEQLANGEPLGAAKTVAEGVENASKVTEPNTNIIDNANIDKNIDNSIFNRQQIEDFRNNKANDFETIKSNTENKDINIQHLPEEILNKADALNENKTINKNNPDELPIKDNTNKEDFGAGHYTFDKRVITTPKGDVNTFRIESPIGRNSAKADFADIQNLKASDEINLVRERNNKVDVNAIAIYANGQKIGYIDKNTARVISPLIDSGKVPSLSAHVVLERMPRSRATKDGEFSKDTIFRTTENRAGKLITDMPTRPKIVLDAAYKGSFEEPAFSKAEKYMEALSNQTDKANEKIASRKDVNNLKNDIDQDTGLNFLDSFTKDENGKDLSIDDVIAKNEASRGENQVEPVKEKVSPEYKKEIEKITSKVESINEKLNTYANLITYHKGKDFTGADRVTKEVLKNLKENDDSLGFFYTDDITHEPVIALNIDKIRKGYETKGTLPNSMKSLDAAIEFTYMHELGHANIKKSFPDEIEFNKFLDEKSQNEFVQKIMKEKIKQGYNSNDRLLLAEETLADMFAGKVRYTDEKGNWKTDELVNYLEKNYPDNPSVFKKVLDFIKESFNKMYGNDFFKIDKNVKEDTLAIKAQLDEMGKLLKDHPYVKSEYDYINNDKISTSAKKDSIKFLRDPNYLDGADYQIGKREYFKTLMETYLPQLKNFDNLLGGQIRAQKDAVFKVGFDNRQEFELNNTKFQHIVLKPLLDNFKKSFGKVEGLNNKEVKLVENLFFGQNGKPTAAELAALPEKIRKGYTSVLEVNKLINLESSKAEMIKIAQENGLLKKPEDFEFFKNTDTFDAKDLLNQLTTKAQSEIKDAKDYDKFQELLRNSLQRANHNIENNVIPRIQTGKHYLEVRAKPEPGQTVGKLLDLRQYASEIQARNDMKRVRATNPDAIASVGQTPKSIVDINSTTNAFNKLLKEAETEKLPFELIKNISKVADNSAKKISSDIYNPKFKDYVDELNKSGKTDVANDLSKLKERIDTPDSSAISKVRAFNAVYNLGGSIASGLANMTSVPLVVTPYMSKYKGGVKNLGSAMKILADKELLYMKMEKEKLPEYLTNKYFDGNSEAKTALEQLLKNGILDDIGDYDINKIKNGIEVTGKVKGAVNLGLETFMKPFAKGEQLNKLVTSVAALKTSLELGSKDHYSFTKDAVYNTQGYYGKAGRPAWASSGLGQLLYQFKTFPLAYFGLWKNMLKDNKKSAALMSALLISLAGTESIPFMSDAEDMIDTVGRVFGNKSINTQKFKEEILQSVLGDSLSKIALYGMLSDFAIPINMSARLSMDNIIPATNIFDPANKDKSKAFMELAGPTGAAIKNIMGGVDNLSNGNLGGAAYSVAPSAFKAAVQGISAGLTGKFTDQKGQNLTDATTSQAIARSFGFQPDSLAGVYRTLSDISKDNQNLKYVKGLATDLLVKARIEGDSSYKDQAKQLIADWNEKNPNEKAKISPNSVTQKINASKQDAGKRFEKGISSELKKEFRNNLKN